MPEVIYRAGMPFGKRRREVEVPAMLPELDATRLMNFQTWRENSYKQPIVDDLLGYYRFDPPTKAGAEIYTGRNTRKVGFNSVTNRLVQRYVEDPRKVRNANQRQVIHTAETTERALSIFWGVAVIRSEVLSRALGNVSDQKPIDEEVAAYSADAIVDFGLCLEEPYENNWKLKTDHRRQATPQGLSDKLESVAPGIGTNLVNFGAFAEDNPDVLCTYDGVVAMQAALTEQDYRIGLWSSRHDAVREAYPDLPLSADILHLHVPLHEMLSMQADLAA